MSDQYPSRELDKIVIRLPDGLRERIRRVAESNGRSVNAELVTLLDRTYPADAAIDECVQEIADLIAKHPAADRGAVWDLILAKLADIRSKSLGE